MFGEAPTRGGSRDKTQDVGTDMVMAALAKVIRGGGRKLGDDPDRTALETAVRREGTEIVLPADPQAMSYDSAIDTLQKIRDDEETKVGINETIRGAHFVDGLVAFNDAMAEVFGWTQAVTVYTFFGPIRPQFIDVPTNFGESRRVIAGRFEIPGVDGYVEVGSTRDRGLTVMTVTGETKKKFQPLFEKLAEVTRRIVAQNSIYRGKAFQLNFDDEGNISSDAPTFMDIRGGEQPIFSKHIEAAVQANILTPIQHTQRVRDLGIPLKRGVLLEGPYGTGKTLVSRQTAQQAVRNGWTFIAVRDVNHLAAALEFARKFQPAVLFAEDVDRSMEGDDRDVAMDKILNTLDGVDSKNAEVMVVLTSNHAETINRAMIRPGRLDAIITVSPPDAEASLRLVKIYAGSLLDPKLDYSPVGESLAGNAAAVIREVVERAKLYALDKVGPDEKFILPPEALTESADTMKRQLGLLNHADVQPPSAGDVFVQLLTESIGRGLNLEPERIAAMSIQVNRTDTRTKKIASAIGVG